MTPPAGCSRLSRRIRGERTGAEMRGKAVRAEEELGCSSMAVLLGEARA